MVKTVLLGMISLMFAAGCKKQEAKAPATLHISGSIEIDPQLAKKTQGSDVIFLIARPATGGPPLAVVRMMGNKYPMAFQITDQNLMMQQQVVDMPLELSVRVDKDGDAMTRNPGDLTGTYEKNPVSLQAHDVVIRVNQSL